MELPWWVIPLAIPPLLLALAGIVLGAPLWAHLVIVVASSLLVGGLVYVAVRVASSSMQSVWISVIYAIWVFIAVVWAVVVATTPACHCA